MKVTLIAGAKYKKEFYRTGDEVEIEPIHVPELIKAKVISPDTEVVEEPTKKDDVLKKTKTAGE
ncbi:hypothetical protein [Paenibacillus polymyxa]|uniref:Uncharacterized protein n=1 Tax=Paenibacillus polymyxa TaxID=1406 RepID=A0ABX2ZAK8_PAEPO|nr:hypothetical protein [Paenibacillus polymyxa]ODA08461.1 hypothetical protein A7312_03355 [Paenibacillus polymyxa]